MEEKTVRVNTPFIRLDALLKFSGIASTGGEAKILIQEGEASLNGEVVHMRGRKCVPGDVVVISGVKISITGG